MSKNNNQVLMDYGFPTYENWTFKDRLVRANEYLLSINMEPIDGLIYGYLGKAFWSRDQKILFKELNPDSEEIQVALLAYANSYTELLAEFRNRMLPTFAFALSFLSLLLGMSFWKNLQIGFAIPVLGSIVCLAIGYLIYFSEKQITIPNGKGKGTMAIVTAIIDYRKKIDKTTDFQNSFENPNAKSGRRSLLTFLRINRKR